MSFFSPEVRRLLAGTPFGEIFPPKPNPPPLSIDGRTAALRVLAKYINELTFFRPGGVGLPPVAFKIPESNFLIEWPDNNQDLVFPCIYVEPAKAQYNVIGLTTYVDESSRDVFASGTVLQWQVEYIENINLQIWASKKSERRAIFAGLETQLMPTEQMSGIRFIMPEYFDQTVCFTMNDRNLTDSEDSARNRRTGTIGLEMRFNIVALVNYVPVQPTVVLDQIGTDVIVESNE